MKEQNIEWTWNDPDHLAAHLHEFSRPVEEILRDLESLMPRHFERADNLDFHREFRLKRDTGTSGLANLTEKDDGSFWAYRKGRSIPSHLIEGKRETTHWVCLWGRWVKGGFLIHTLYPGRKAPREIHDPKLSLEDLGEAVDFWSRHAIVVKKGEFFFEPDVG